MNTLFQRYKVIQEARTWLDTPYFSCADVKGAGVDCGMILVRVFCDTGICEPFDPRPYSPDWHLHKREEKYLSFVSERCKEIKREEADIGDIIVFRIGRCYAHGGIITNPNPLTIIHAYSKLGKVVETAIQQCSDLNQQQRRPRFFSYFEGKP